MDKAKLEKDLDRTPDKIDWDLSGKIKIVPVGEFAIFEYYPLSREILRHEK